MRIIILITTLMVVTTLYAHAQFNGRCGNFRYTINGKLVNATKSNQTTIKTYYAVDVKKGYIWFWKEISEPGNQQINEYISMWARLTDVDRSCVEQVSADPSTVKVRLMQKQNFFFTTMYNQQKKGPVYGVRNDLLISFSNSNDAANFINQLKNQIPNYNY